MKLFVGESRNQVVSDLKIAKSIGARTKGLIGTTKLADSALWIERCNWIHTFFMSIPIDVVYIDKKMKIRKIDHSLNPWKLPAPVFAARSVIELPAGLAMAKKLQIGDQLHVGD